jgi:hypothetical protein
MAPGPREYTLELGRFKSHNRLIYYFRNPSLLQGDQIKQKLKRDEVLTAPGHHRNALNLISNWNSDLASVIVATPIVLSFFAAIVWAIVAARVYKADVQISVQTGFTIGSYVVTAGE